MAGNSLTVSSSLQCPHGGTVQIISTNTRVKDDGSFAATMNDTFTITGCPFQIPAGPAMVPSPCIMVQWVMPDARVRVNNGFTLSQSSTGICMSAVGIPQGPVMVVNTQSKVKSM